jgi:hypothetical protein
VVIDSISEIVTQDDKHYLYPQTIVLEPDIPIALLHILSFSISGENDQHFITSPASVSFQNPYSRGQITVWWSGSSFSVLIESADDRKVM